MKVKPYFKNEDELYFENYMKLCGIYDIDKFIKCTTLEDSYKYNNIENGIALLEKYKDKTVYLLVDSDLDGYTSASMSVVFCKSKFPNMNIVPLLHHKHPKAHGLNDKCIMSKLYKSEPSLLWIPDAGTSDSKYCEKLSSRGFEILITDHHQPNQENQYATIINNKTSDVNNKCGSGCLVTWHLLKCIDSKLANSLISYVMLSLIGDSMDMNDYENRTFCNRGKDKIHKNLLPLIENFNKGNTNKDYSFGCVSKINAVIRVGELEDKEKLFNCLCGQDNFDNFIERMKDLHSFQKYEVERIMNDIDIDNSKYYILCKINESTPLSGLIANKIMSKYNKPTILVHEEDSIYSGSVRSNVDEFKSILENSNMFEYNSGHTNAFGTAYLPNKEKDIIKYLDSFSCDDSIKVLYSSSLKSMSKRIWDIKSKIDEYNLNGKGMLPTSIHIKPFFINGKDLERLGNGSTLKFDVGNYVIMFFFMGEDKREELKVGKNCEYQLEIIGEPNINVYNGKTTLQIIVDSFEVNKKDISWEDMF